MEKAKLSILNRNESMRNKILESKLNIVKSGLEYAYESKKLNEELQKLTERLIGELKKSEYEYVYN